MKRVKVLFDSGDTPRTIWDSIIEILLGVLLIFCPLAFGAVEGWSEQVVICLAALYTHRVVSLAVRLVVEDGLPYQAASWHLWRDHRVFVPFATIQNWVEAGGEKGGPPNGDDLS